MGINTTIATTPVDHLRLHQPDHPVGFFTPKVLQSTLARFQRGFPGLVTYALKANPRPEIIENLVAGGLTGFDVASPAEINLVRNVCDRAVLHYNNPVRSVSEIAFAVAHNVRSFSVDNFSELDKLAKHMCPEDVEISVRLKLEVAGAAYDFGEKFGAGPEKCVGLLRAAKNYGFTPSMTFHPGTQCQDPTAWKSYIHAAAGVSQQAGIALTRLNVGGGFPSHRGETQPELGRIFRAIRTAMSDAFGDAKPKLVCEPGRAMVAEAITLAARVKAISDEGDVFLNDGLYGGLAELPVIEANRRISVVKPTGQTVAGAVRCRRVFGPTCDSLDVLPENPDLPDGIREGDYVLFAGMGAYSYSVGTGFNGYGQIETVTLR